MNNDPLRTILGFAGRNGPMMLLGGVFVGLLAPPLADAARPLLGAAVFVFTLGAFLKVDLASFRAELSRPVWIGAVLLWSGFGVPLLTWWLVKSAGGDANLGQAMVLAMLAPPAGTAAAIAAIMGLSAPLALLVMITVTIISPITLPALAAWLTGTQLSIDPLAMTARLLLIVGGACASAVLIRRFAGGFVRDNPNAMTGVTVAGLILVAIGAMRGMDALILSQPGRVASYCGLAFAMNVGFQCLGAIMFQAFGHRNGLTVGLVSGNRNITLIWASLGSNSIVAPDVELYLGMSVLVVFILPVATGWVVRWCMRGRPATI